MTAVPAPRERPDGVAVERFFTLGLYGSASTWAFNVAAQALRRSRRVATAYAEDAPTLSAATPPDVDVGVVKSHRPDEGLLREMETASGTVLVTIRDPLDCVASLMRRFGMTFGDASAAVETSARSVLRVADAFPTTILRYEDDARGADAVTEVANAAGCVLPRDAAQSIADDHRPERVRARIEALERDGAFGTGGDRGALFDPTTHWHPGHVGKGTVGTYGDAITGGQVHEVEWATRAFRRRFGYGGMGPGDAVSFGAGRSCLLESGFSYPEDWGSWTCEDEAEVVVPLNRPATRAVVNLFVNLSPCLRRDGPAVARILVSGDVVAEIRASSGNPANAIVAVDARYPKPTPQASLVVRFDGVQAPCETGHSGDSRRLGLGLVRLDVLGIA